MLSHLFLGIWLPYLFSLWHILIFQHPIIILGNLYKAIHIYHSIHIIYPIILSKEQVRGFTIKNATKILVAFFVSDCI